MTKYTHIICISFVYTSLYVAFAFLMMIYDNYYHTKNNKQTNTSAQTERKTL